MKTNVILNSPDRVLLGVQIRQETSTGFLNLSDLQDAYDSIRVQKGWVKKHIPELISRRENIERIYYMLFEQSIIKVDLSTFIENCSNMGTTAYLKSINGYKTTGARHTKTTWCNPYIWVLLAMELNPEIYAKVILWLTDKLILNRIEAGNFYKNLTSQISKWNNVNYALIAKLINLCVLGRHALGIRQVCTESELKSITEFEKKLAFAIEEGFIKSELELQNFIISKTKAIA